MVIITNSQNSDLLFFKRNYVLYDPEKDQQHEFNEGDLQKLLSAPVVLWGQNHHAFATYETECEGLRRIAHSVSCCVMTEALKPGQVVKKPPLWKNIPDHIVFHGADVRRHSSNASEFIRLQEQFIKMMQSSLKVGEAKDEVFRDWAKCITEALDSGLGKMDEKEKIITLPNAYRKRLGLKSLSKVDILMKELRACNSSLPESPSEGPEIQKSNQGLLNEVLKTYQHFQKTICIWGAAHFLLGHQMVEGLKKAGIQHCILLPSDQLLQEIIREHEWQKDVNESSSIRIHFSRHFWNDTALKIPNRFHSFFPPSCQPLFASRPPFATLNSLQLAKELDSKGSLTLSSSSPPFRLDGISASDFSAIEDAMRVSPKGKLQFLQGFNDRLVEGIQGALMLGNYELKALRFAHVEVCAYYPPHHASPQLQFAPYGPAQLEVIKGSSIGPASHLFREMRKHGVDFEMQAGGSILFCDIDSEELDRIFQKNELGAWLNSRAPQGYRVVIQGDIQVGCKYYKRANQKGLGLLLKTDKGLKISLTR